MPGQVVTNYREALVGAASLTYRVLEGADHGLSETSAQQGYHRDPRQLAARDDPRARADAQAAEIAAHVPRGPAETA